MANWKWFAKAHVAVFKASGGRIGSKMAGIDIVLVDAVGRKTGHVRSVPIACYPYKDSVVVVASNNGLEKDPVWWLNLQAQPEVWVHLGKERFIAVAEELKAEERSKIWPEIIRINPRQKHYAENALRVLPVVYLKRKPV